MKIIHITHDAKNNLDDLIKDYLNSRVIVSIQTDTVDKPEIIDGTSIYKIPNDNYDYDHILLSDFKERRSRPMYSNIWSYFKRGKENKSFQLELANEDNIDIQITRVGSVLKEIQDIIEPRRKRA